MFDLPRFEAAQLEAAAFIGGKVCAAHVVGTAGAPVKLDLRIDDEGVAAAPGESDLLFAHASLLDEKGNLCTRETREVAFSVEGAAELIGPANITAEAGIAAVLGRVAPGVAGFTVSARAAGAGPALATGMWNA